VVLLLVLAGSGLVFWRLSKGSSNDRSEAKKDVGKSEPVFPLKFEKLTSAGQSNLVAISPDGKYLAYTRSMKQLLEGGPPEKLASFAEDELFDFGYSFDNQLVAITRGKCQNDVVLISDLNQH
jgi:hypothetical protein